MPAAGPSPSGGDRPGAASCHLVRSGGCATTRHRTRSGPGRARDIFFFFFKKKLRKKSAGWYVTCKMMRRASRLGPRQRSNYCRGWAGPTQLAGSRRRTAARGRAHRRRSASVGRWARHRAPRGARRSANRAYQKADGARYRALDMYKGPVRGGQVGPDPHRRRRPRRRHGPTSVVAIAGRKRRMTRPMATPRMKAKAAWAKGTTPRAAKATRSSRGKYVSVAPPPLTARLDGAAPPALLPARLKKKQPWRPPRQGPVWSPASVCG